ncbi:pancreatic lipase-related protein 3 isoform X1 [Homo sapiens]|uniref:pancreatic lipase-related protein 3 isoform X1 n=1 Tax=Homo sapiens TaxID=9606 RepID=UPI0005D018D5|nr:pancreatic lipase-related protein 3 isoform X1 [Homo sapiens]|eukprot:XP_011537578.1 pancreatic lipase-related protein 3 isoform X1 [Homo sapiens]
MLGIWIVAFLFFGTSRGKEVCYERLGCFKDGLPWTRTFSTELVGLPWSPEKINTRFLLYTIHNPNAYQEISAVNSSTIQASYFGTDKITRINIAGWKTDGKWQRDMCNVLLQLEDINCINLDWINGSREYIHAVNNLRVVGAEVAYFIDVLMKKFEYSPSKVHLIGHSLGAHLAGEAGSRIPGLGRITGLDPAGPFFHNTPKEVRLDPSDANFVDVIHTNAARILFELGVGTIDACGHLDFYPNGGKHMPGCEDLITPLLKFNFNAYKKGWRHKLSVKLSGSEVTQGTVFLRVGGAVRKTGEFAIVSGKLEPGMTYTKLIDADVNVGNITSVQFIWKKHLFEDSQNKLGAEMVINTSGKYGYKSTFCSQDIMGPNILQNLKPC